jgi:hypothetical protein
VLPYRWRRDYEASSQMAEAPHETKYSSACLQRVLFHASSHMAEAPHETKYSSACLQRVLFNGLGVDAMDLMGTGLFAINIAFGCRFYMDFLAPSTSSDILDRSRTDGLIFIILRCVVLALAELNKSYSAATWLHAIEWGKSYPRAATHLHSVLTWITIVLAAIPLGAVSKDLLEVFLSARTAFEMCEGSDLWLCMTMNMTCPYSLEQNSRMSPYPSPSVL